MKLRLLLAFAVFFSALAGATAADSGRAEPIEFKRLDLLDGRKLRDVVIRTYDVRTDKVLLLANKKAMTIAVELIPPPFAQQIRENAPHAGSTVSNTAPDQTRPPVASPAAPPRTPPPPSAPPRENLEPHRAAAIDRAMTFYRYEFKVGSDASRVESVRISTETPVAVTGWSGRYRTKGTAYLEVFDTKGWSATRATSTFEVVTEKKPNEPVVALEFDRKS